MDSNVCVFLLTSFLLTSVLITQSTAISLTYYGVQDIAEVNEDRIIDNAINCTGIRTSVSGWYTSVSWKVTQASTVLLVANCSTYYHSCDSRSALGYTARRLSEDFCTMTIDPTKRVDLVLNGTIVCEAGFRTGNGNDYESVRVPMDVIYPSKVESCSVQANISTTPWTVSVRCSISKTYSSLARYTCQWYRKQGSSNENAMGQPTKLNTLPLYYTSHHVSGSCDVTFPLPSVGLYSYRVVVSPGSISKEAGKIEIRWPSASHNCPQYTVENQNVNCTCGGDVGSPPGILQWSNGYTQVTLSKLHISQNMTQFRCQAVWNGSVVHEAVYTLIVLALYVPPMITQFTLNSQRGNLSAAEYDYVTFSCGATGRPTPDTQIINSEGVVSSGSKGGEVTPNMPVQWLILTVPAQCQHTGTYWCTGSNPAGTGTSENVTLFVNCGPRTTQPPPNTPASVNFLRDPVHLVFDLLAYPVPDSFVFNYLGSSPDNPKGRQVPDNTLYMTCYTAHALYAVSCEVTVENLTAEEFGFYSVQISNDFGSVQMEFEVRRDIEGKADNTEANIAAIVAGAAGGVVVLVVIVVVVIVCYFRKRICGDRAYASADNGRGKEESQVYTELGSISKNDTSSKKSSGPALPAPRNPYVTDIPEQYHNAAFEPSNGAPALHAPKNPPVTEITGQYQNMAFEQSNEAADGNNADQGMYEEPRHKQGVADTDTGTETGPSGSTMYIEMSPGQQI